MRRLLILFLGVFLTLSLSGQRLIPGIVASQSVTIAAAGFCDEYQTVYDALDVKPGTDTAAAQNTLVSTLVTGGQWAKLELFYLQAQRTAAGGLINMIAPGTYNCTNVNATTFTKYTGYTGASTKYLNTNFRASLDSSLYKRDHASIGVYLLLDQSGTTIPMGVQSYGSYFMAIRPRYNGNFYGALNQSAAASGIAVANSQGLFTVVRSGRSLMTLYKGGTDLGDLTTISTLIPDSRYVTFLMHDNSNWSTNTVAAGFLGGELSDGDVTAINNAIETYMDAIGIGVQ